MSFIDALDANPFHDFIPVLTLVIIWFIFVMIVFLIYSLRSGPTEKWAKTIYYKCDTRPSRFIQIVRLIIETPSTHHNITDSAICLILLDNKSPSPHILANIVVDRQRFNTFSRFSEEEPNKSVVRFLLHTRDSLKDMESVILNMKTSDSWKVFYVEIQDIFDESSEANVAQVGLEIRHLTAKKAHEIQNFPIISKLHRDIEDSFVSSRTLNVFEYIIFIWMAFNLIAFFPSVFVICHGKQILCDNYDFHWLSSVYTGLTSSSLSAMVFLVLICIYRYLIKYKLEKTLDSCLWQAVQVIFLCSVIGIGVTAALMASILVPSHEHSDHKSMTKGDISIYWELALITGIVAFLLFWISVLSLLGNCFNFFTKSVETKPTTIVGEEDNDPNKASSPEPQPKAGSPLEESDNYFKELVKGGHKVKSISQYGKTVKTSPTNQNKDNQSLDDSYYKELIKTGGKVTSVSQYKE